MTKKHHIVVVVGPTASGKSDFAVELAHTLNGEIISTDSRQVYKGLDIGTGKITQEEMQGIPHYMLDVYELGEEVSVARFKEDATKIIEDIIARGKTPILCGGTGQYIDALIFDTELPQVPPNNELRNELEKKSTSELFELLLKKDSARAETIDKHNRVRIIRALEVVATLGKVPKLAAPNFIYDTTIYLMNPTREVLRARIIKRIEKRIAQGMIEEVEAIHKQGYSKVMMKRFGIEYDIIGDYLDTKISFEEMKTILGFKCNQYAKRQQTWNKKYLPYAKCIDVLK